MSPNVVQAVKVLQLPYEPTSDVLSLLEAFRDMVNYCIQIGLERRVTSRFTLQNEVYHQLASFGLHSWYRLSAVEAATAILKNYRKAKRTQRNVRVPRVKKLLAKLGNQGYKIIDGTLRLPIKPRDYFYVPLHKRAVQTLSDATLKLGSVTLTPCMVSLAFSKTTDIAVPKTYVAYDTNERSIDGASIGEDGALVLQSYDLSRISEIRHGYFERVRRIQTKYADDRRVARKIQRKWFANQSRKVNTVLHQTSSAIVRDAKSNEQGVVLEDLRNIRNTINRRILAVTSHDGRIRWVSEHSRRLKRRLNSWSFRRLQSFIEYKALWDGVKVIKVNPRNTSRVCAVCGWIMRDPKAKTLECCGINRHLNACLNLLRIQDERVRFTLDRSAHVALIRPLDKAVSRSGEVNSSGHRP